MSRLAPPQRSATIWGVEGGVSAVIEAMMLAAPFCPPGEATRAMSPSLDAMSGDRMRLGVTVEWSKAALEALRYRFTERGQRGAEVASIVEPCRARLVRQCQCQCQCLCRCRRDRETGAGHRRHLADADGASRQRPGDRLTRLATIERAR